MIAGPIIMICQAGRYWPSFPRTCSPVFSNLTGGNVVELPFGGFRKTTNMAEIPKISYNLVFVGDFVRTDPKLDEETRGMYFCGLICIYSCCLVDAIPRLLQKVPILQHLVPTPTVGAGYFTILEQNRFKVLFCLSMVAMWTAAILVIIDSIFRICLHR